MNKQNVAIWLYGSYARGCEDQYSDYDILAVCDHPVSLNKNELPILIPEEKISLTYYTWTEIKGMASYGSLFLHHLSCEAKIIYESEEVEGRLSAILNKLCFYKKASKDIRAFFTVLNDIEEAIKYDYSISYELSVIGTVLRHSCILGCYIGGFQKFGRSEPVEIFVKQWGLDHAIAQDFNKLYCFRLHSQRENCAIPLVNSDYLLLWCARVKSILKIIKEQVDIYERDMFATNYSS